MTEDSVSVFWKRVSELMRERVSSQDWCSWFNAAELIELGAEGITLSLVNSFAAEWVDNNFREELERSVADVAGVPLAVTIVSRETAVAAQRPHENIAAAAQRGSLQAQSREHAPADKANVARSAPRPTSGGTSAVGSNEMTEDELRAELGQAAPSFTLGPIVDSPAPQRSTGQGGGFTQNRAQPTPPDTGPEERAFGAGRLNPRYRFETFVVGESSRMTHAAALAVAESPSQTFNPLFIYGGTGLGKTHLLHAIGHYIADTRPQARVAYVTTEQFVTRFIQAIQATKSGGGNRWSSRDAFKAYFRGVDVLLMDDVQFLAGKGEALQEELFHIFNALHEAGRQVVLTSDCKPDMIPKLESRLSTRFAWGLITDIERPDRETRIAILRKKARVDGADVPAEVFELIAERINTNVRELEGVLTRVVAAASLSSNPVTPELARNVLEHYTPAKDAPITIDRIQDVVCEHFALSREDLLSARKTAPLSHPRQIAMYLSRVLIGAPSTQIAQRFNRKDHSTVLHAERKIDGLMRDDQETHDLVAQLTESIRANQSVPHAR